MLQTLPVVRKSHVRVGAEDKALSLGLLVQDALQLGAHAGHSLAHPVSEVAVNLNVEPDGLSQLNGRESLVPIQSGERLGQHLLEPVRIHIRLNVDGDADSSVLRLTFQSGTRPSERALGEVVDRQVDVCRANPTRHRYYLLSAVYFAATPSARPGAAGTGFPVSRIASESAAANSFSRENGLFLPVGTTPFGGCQTLSRNF